MQSSSTRGFSDGVNPARLLCDDSSCSSSQSKCSRSPSNNALLTVFQANPLVFQTNDGTGFHPTPELDFTSEQNLLTECLSDAFLKIDIAFDIATTDRLGNFLSKGQGRVLHFSCHGHPDYLMIENGWGAMHPIPVEDLRSWIQKGGDSLLFVFVSACHSRSAGEAFVKAGVKHVVCCHRDDQPIRNISSALFAGAFYKALANGRVLQQAFELAREEVMCCPHLDRHTSRAEMEKFVILPENGDHNVVIFQESPPEWSPLKSLSPPYRARLVPLPFHIFEGRRLDMYYILDALKSCRLVRVTGPRGIGKASVVQQVCQYIQERRRLFKRSFSDLIWLSSSSSSDELSGILPGICSIFTACRDEKTYRRCRDKWMNYFFTKKVLLVIDARISQRQEPSNMISSFLSDVIRDTTNTRIIVIHPLGDNTSIVEKLPCVEHDIDLEPLSFESSVRLFGKVCQHVANSRDHRISNWVQLEELLVPESNALFVAKTRRTQDLFRMIGSGIPADIIKAAKTMRGDEYDRLITLGRRKEWQFDYKSRTALEKDFYEVVFQIQRAAEEGRFQDAQAHQECLDEMEMLRESFMELSTLRSSVSSFEINQGRAIQSKDFAAAARLQVEIDRLNQKINIEKRAMEELGVEEDDDHVNETNQKRETRVELELQITMLECELDCVCEINNFSAARKIHSRIQEMRDRASSLPTKDQLLKELSATKKSLEQAKKERNWDLAEDLFRKCNETQILVDAEIEAASLVTGAESNSSTIVKPGAVSIGPVSRLGLSDSMDELDADNDFAELPLANQVMALDEFEDVAHAGNGDMFAASETHQRCAFGQVFREQNIKKGSVRFCSAINDSTWMRSATRRSTMSSVPPSRGVSTDVAIIPSRVNATNNFDHILKNPPSRGAVENVSDHDSESEENPSRRPYRNSSKIVSDSHSERGDDIHSTSSGLIPSEFDPPLDMFGAAGSLISDASFDPSLEVFGAAGSSPNNQEAAETVGCMVSDEAFVFGSSIVDEATGHLSYRLGDRLELVRIIRESLATMTVEAVKVEAIPRKRRRQLKDLLKFWKR